MAEFLDPIVDSSALPRPRLGAPSLPESHRTIAIPSTASWLRKVFAFAGPGYLVAVGYMDPGNWATDLQGGSQFGYTLLSGHSFSATSWQCFSKPFPPSSVSLPAATLPKLARTYSRRTSIFLWIVCEIAIAACDLAEVLGSAVALQLLFHIPLLLGVILTALDILIVLLLQGRGFRMLEPSSSRSSSPSAPAFAYEIFSHVRSG